MSGNLQIDEKITGGTASVSTTTLHSRRILSAWDPLGPDWKRVPTTDELPEPPNYGKHRIFHYTTIYWLASTLRKGYIDVWPEVDLPRIAHLAWFSSNSLFELDSVAAGELDVDIRSGLESFKTPGEGPTDAVRIEVNARAAPYKWYDYWASIGVPPLRIAMQGIADGEGVIGDPEQWFVNPLPVPASEWLAVEIFDPETLQWKPIALSSDRMVGELITLLPAHLRPPVVDTPDEKQRRLSPTVRNSEWCLQNIGLEYRRDENGREHKTNTLCNVGDHWLEKIQTAIFMWRMADGYARAGVPVFPLDGDGRPFSPWERYGATTSLEFVDRIWLQEHPSARMGVVLGTPYPGIVGLRLSGWHRRYAPWQGGRLPATWRFHEEQGQDRSVLLLFRAPPGVVLPSGVLARTARGCIELIGQETWIRGPGRYGGYGIYRIAGPKDIAPLPDWVVRKVISTRSRKTREE